MEPSAPDKYCFEDAQVVQSAILLSASEDVRALSLAAAFADVAADVDILVTSSSSLQSPRHPYHFLSNPLHEATVHNDIIQGKEYRSIVDWQSRGIEGGSRMGHDVSISELAGGAIYRYIEA